MPQLVCSVQTRWFRVWKSTHISISKEIEKCAFARFSISYLKFSRFLSLCPLLLFGICLSKISYEHLIIFMQKIHSSYINVMYIILSLHKIYVLLHYLHFNFCALHIPFFWSSWNSAFASENKIVTFSF